MSGDGSGVPATIARVVTVVVSLAILSWLFRPYNKRARKAATGGAANAFAVNIAPLPSLKSAIAELREMVGEGSPEPNINRYKRPVMTADASGLTISERKSGRWVIVPATDIVSLEARIVPMKQLGATIKMPSVWLTARRGGGAEVSVAIAPLVGAGGKAAQAQLQEIVNELSTRIGLPTAPGVAQLN